MNKHPAVAVEKERKKNLDLNTAFRFRSVGSKQSL